MADDAWIKKHEAKMNELVRGLGLTNWEVVWRPIETQGKRGLIVPENQVIIVYDHLPKFAMRTVLHEVIELKLRPAFNVQMSLSNALIEWANAQAYKMKERSIEDLLDVIDALGSDELKGILEG